MLPFNCSNVWDNPGARKDKVRLGRGRASGKGKTCGRGHKGQYARAGGTINRGFEGGQSNLTRRFPKHGFRKYRFNVKQEYEQLNLGTLAYHIEKGNIDTSKTITMKDMFDAGLLSKVQYGVKLLSKGADKFVDLKLPVSIEISDASLSAIEAVKQNGGNLQV